MKKYNSYKENYEYKELFDKIQKIYIFWDTTTSKRFYRLTQTILSQKNEMERSTKIIKNLSKDLKEKDKFTTKLNYFSLIQLEKEVKQKQTKIYDIYKSINNRLKDEFPVSFQKFLNDYDVMIFDYLSEIRNSQNLLKTYFKF